MKLYEHCEIALAINTEFHRFGHAKFAALAASKNDA
jgi:hypothetical protein